MQNVHIKFWQDLGHYCLPEDIYGATAYKKGLHFLLCRINKLNHDFFQGQMSSLVCPPEKPRHRFHPISP